MVEFVMPFCYLCFPRESVDFFSQFMLEICLIFHTWLCSQIYVCPQVLYIIYWAVICKEICQVSCCLWSNVRCFFFSFLIGIQNNWSKFLVKN